MSKLLKNFLKYIILPSATIIVSKVVGLYFAINFFNLDFFLETRPEQIYSVQLYFVSQGDALIANSVSNLFMLGSIGLISIYFLTRYRLSKLAEYNPRVLVKLNNLYLMPWVNKKGDTFLKIFVWVLFLWVVSINSVVDTIGGNSFLWIAILSLTISVLSTWVLIRTFEIEDEILYSSNKAPNLY